VDVLILDVETHGYTFLPFEGSSLPPPHCQRTGSRTTLNP
jgi:hypothetical protein